MVRWPDLTSPAQLRGSTKITLSKPVGVHRSLRNHAKAQLPAATRYYGPLLSPTRRTAGQTKQSFRRRGAPPRSQGTGSPPSTRAPRLTNQGKLCQSPPDQQGSRNTAHSSGATTIRRRAPQLTPVMRGPQEGSSALKPQRPGSKGEQGKRLVSRPWQRPDCQAEPRSSR
ncbi:hypothetical protein NDU88_004114 [Pleurodeles waltl]|uniref:Uncharacterized protein n=1 Tax=Pleurodeles waltl TaxID=8319 RepID=A0AAV7NMI9_PLEWA|nr:hypothetical protein NDU88_004114 [Pleurodeles waltl]